MSDLIIVPNQDYIKTHMQVCFSDLSGLIPFRSFPEKGSDGNNSASNCWIKPNEYIDIKANDFAIKANCFRAGCYMIPATVAKHGEARSSDILQTQTLLIDIDDGDTENKLETLSKVLGVPTLIVESGGITEEEKPKLHIYWKLKNLVEGAELKQLLELRYRIALAVGGDTHYKSAHQPIRLAGSIYHKNNANKLVKIRSHKSISYELSDLIKSAEKLQQTIEGLWKVQEKKGEGVGLVQRRTYTQSNITSYLLGSFLSDNRTMPNDLISPRILTPSGMFVFGGAPKVGKSDFLLSLFVHMAAGKEFNGFKPPKMLLKHNGRWVCEGYKPTKTTDLESMLTRVDIIITFLESEAINGKFYSMQKFSELFANRNILCSKRSIYDDCSIAASWGKIKFFNNPSHYGLDIAAPKGYGFMCSQNMTLIKNDNLAKILPTHCKINNKKQKVKNADNWIQNIPNLEVGNVA